MRVAIAVSAAALLCACSPEIGTGTYFCGPERLCPPDLECNDQTITCVVPAETEAFSCPAAANTAEPDNDLDSARDLGTLACGVIDPLIDAPGCVPEIGDVDLYKFEYDDECSGADPHIEVVVRFPVAFVPLALELLDAEGAVIGAGELCTSTADRTGTDRVCLESRLASGTYYLRVRVADDAPDCDGTCHYNRYLVAFSLPLS